MNFCVSFGKDKDECVHSPFLQYLPEPWKSSSSTRLAQTGPQTIIVLHPDKPVHIFDTFYHTFKRLDIS